MGFCCKILSLNDLTPNPISRPGTHCLQWQRANARANLWWRQECFPAKPASRSGPVLEKLGSQKGLGDAWVSFYPTDVVNLTWIVRFRKKFTFNRAQDVVCQPLVYSAHCCACWSQGSHSNSAREISRAIFTRGGVGRHILSVCCHNWKHNDFPCSGAYFIYQFCVSHKYVLVGY